MADLSSPVPTVLTTGGRCSIEVPSARAASLLAYLRCKGISLDTPEPSSTGMERIVLHRGADVEKVQALLDAWAQSLAGRVMPPTKTLAEREKELQDLLRTAEGRADLEALAARYRAAGGRDRPPRTSVVTYILVHERQRGLIES